MCVRSKGTHTHRYKWWTCIKRSRRYTCRILKCFRASSPKKREAVFLPLSLCLCPLPRSQNSSPLKRRWASCRLLFLAPAFVPCGWFKVKKVCGYSYFSPLLLKLGSVFQISVQLFFADSFWRPFARGRGGWYPASHVRTQLQRETQGGMDLRAHESSRSYCGSFHLPLSPPVVLDCLSNIV